MKKAFLQLHLAVFLAGFTGILGKLIQLNESVLVWYRLLISAGSLWVIAALGRRPVSLAPKQAMKIFGIGAIAAVHWVFFYGAIKWANVSVALVCFSSIGFFTALFEPLVFSRRLQRRELILGTLVIIGISFIFQFDPGHRTGILLGILAAISGSIFPILSRKVLRFADARTVTLYELSGGFLFLTLCMPFFLWKFPQAKLLPSQQDWIWLLVLSWVCTVIAFNLSMQALRKITAFTVNLTFNLEPVYGIAMAFLFFREDKTLGMGFYFGLVLMLLAIGWEMFSLLRFGAARRPAVETSQKPMKSGVDE